ncbi:bifunctional aspartate kinase/homoserine dehydrogenase I [Marinigracilibium pacificum]|uniref:Bifunctional aspartate kinase/homoserine dehydrogenase I n=1 Tax=Marinigracilibium pacificum TaxID=2729599 RepID=A0A848J892_9BACT|nr:bifunctional aspartate kinase/homoserine dehydrogenase I [Marinigracilibium pacificum]NMM50644.1 bifunctional aspartate kinase/homoserine dehydrogenase I [Marinigracilibium pacificum]
MKVIKFGGTSVGSPHAIREVQNIIEGFDANGEKIAVVVSAQSGITNKLVRIGTLAADQDEEYTTVFNDIETQLMNLITELMPINRQSQIIAEIKKLLNDLEDVVHGVYLLRELTPRSADFILSFGERFSARIISAFLLVNGIDANYTDAREIIKTNSSFGEAKVDFDETGRLIHKYFDTNQKLNIVTGFIASNDKGQTTTLGRGGSDYTAAILGAVLEAEEIQIWTDVDGVMTADPKKVKRAFSLPTISYMEAMEMTHFGAKVIYPRTLQPAVAKNIPLRIKNTFNQGFDGTVISDMSVNSDYTVKGITSMEDVVLVNFQGAGMVGVPGIASRLFGSLARAEINVVLITQASSEHSITFAVLPKDAEKCRLVVEAEFEREIETGKIDQPNIEYNLSIVACIGEKMRETPGISGKLFSTLGKNGVNIKATAQGSSELNISVVIEKPDLSKALNALHGAFFKGEIHSLNVFMVGAGLIGKTLWDQIKDQYEYFINERRLNIKLVGIANSRKMLFDKEGIDLDNWYDQLMESGEQSDIHIFVQRMKEFNLPQSVFIDNTASKEIAAQYKKILNSRISVVTPNKHANSGPYRYYKELKEAELKNGVKYLYETNVSAGLPVIKTIEGLKLSGDRVIKVEGVLSGTISYLFNNFDGSKPFSELVKEAKEKGYTEPDPREDLNGMDVARKLLILARETGHNLEPEDINLEKMLPESCFDVASVDDFFVELKKFDDVMLERKNEAEKEGKKLRYIACLDNGKAEIKLITVGPGHPLFDMSGSDNVVSYTSQRYKERPMVIKGPGAGAEVTASGVFADVLLISSYLE